LGPRKSLVYTYEHLSKEFRRILGVTRTSAHRMTEASARAYQPPAYDGNVLLLLAADRAPHVNLAEGWQTLITGDLRVHYLDAHHRDLLEGETAQRVADLILAHRPFPSSNEPVVDVNEMLQKAS
jgi:thioesterase domain-containing protein